MSGNSNKLQDCVDPTPSERARRVSAARPSWPVRVGTIGGVVGVAATLGLAKMIGNALYLVPPEHSGLLDA